MIFGGPNSRKGGWQRKFIWLFPKKLVDDRWVWWHEVERCNYVDNREACRALGITMKDTSFFGDYVYRLIQRDETEFQQAVRKVVGK